MAIEIDKISKSFGETDVFRDFSLYLPDTGCVCLFGPSGSGKTTLLNLIANLEHPDTGKISRPASDISVVFQEDRLLPWVSAQENIKLVLENKYASSKEALKIAGDWLATVFLEESAAKKPAELSGGMRRRIALARALAFGGSSLLLDEPFTGMDTQIKNALFPLMSEIKKEKLIVLITHYPEEAVRLSDVVHVLSGSPVRIAETIRIRDEDRDDPQKTLRLAKRLTAHFPADA
jgi:NitT/TauT family transport system ATP-binding protein